MDKVLDGVLAFKENIYPEYRELFSDLAGGQSPEVLLVTCADSRIDPALITQTYPGDLFICRNAGNIVPPYGPDAEGNVASIEFAVAALGVKHIVVCGHSDCGAMKGAMNPEGLDALPHVCGWVGHSAAAVDAAKAAKPELEGKALLKEVTEQNVLLQLQNLKTHPQVAAGLEAGKLTLHGWVYDIGEGVIFAHNEATGDFEQVTKPQEAAA